MLKCTACSFYDETLSDERGTFISVDKISAMAKVLC